VKFSCKNISDPARNFEVFEGIQIPFHRQIYHLKGTFSNPGQSILENGSEIIASR